MTPLGIDPGALLSGLGSDELVEVTLERLPDRLMLRVERETGDEITLDLRPDFLDAALAQARTSEAAA